MARIEKLTLAGSVKLQSGIWQVVISLMLVTFSDYLATTRDFANGISQMACRKVKHEPPNWHAPMGCPRRPFELEPPTILQVAVTSSKQNSVNSPRVLSRRTQQSKTSKSKSKMNQAADGNPKRKRECSSEQKE